MTMIYVKPTAGRRVMDPNQIPPAPLPAAGTLVEKSIYWDRRLKDGDVEVVSKAAAPSSVEPKPKAKSATIQ
jgi:hypothetical protein